jgi:hypothetical protein
MDHDSRTASPRTSAKIDVMATSTVEEMPAQYQKPALTALSTRL